MWRWWCGGEGVELEEVMGLWRVNLIVKGECQRSSPGKQVVRHFVGCHALGVSLLKFKTLSCL